MWKHKVEGPLNTLLFEIFKKIDQEPRNIVQKFVWRTRVVAHLYIEPKNRAMYVEGLAAKFSVALCY